MLLEGKAKSCLQRSEKSSDFGRAGFGSCVHTVCEGWLVCFDTQVLVLRKDSSVPVIKMKARVRLQSAPHAFGGRGGWAELCCISLKFQLCTNLHVFNACYFAQCWLAINVFIATFVKSEISSWKLSSWQKVKRTRSLQGYNWVLLLV